MKIKTEKEQLQEMYTKLNSLISFQKHDVLKAKTKYDDKQGTLGFLISESFEDIRYRYQREEEILNVLLDYSSILDNSIKNII